ncbi:MAG: M48 family metallopeptidase [Lachnospiraceae bacterium]|nr:M48 family metallopeptidase [Lachnospiraceae bacterium]
MKTEELRSVFYKGQKITYVLRRKKVKNVNLRISRDGSVSVSASPRVSISFIESFVEERAAFILKTQEEFARKADFSVGPDQYETGEILRILGYAVPLEILEGSRESIDLMPIGGSGDLQGRSLAHLENTVDLQGYHLVLTLRNPAHLQKKRHMVDEWMKGLVSGLFLRLMEKGYRAYTCYGVPFPELRIKTMTSRWGSCQPRRKVITLNNQLIHYPLAAIEYVVWHEYAHFIEANHSKAFYAVLEKQMPDWRDRKALLNPLKE